MGHAFFTLLFTAGACRYLRTEFGGTPDYRRHRLWLALTVAIQLVASALSAAFPGVIGNFLLHGLGGGVACALVFTYLVRTFGVRVGLRVQVLGLFMFVSTLGVLNELAEYGVELAQLRIYSEDTHDTWRDLVANTTGALTAFALVALAARARPDCEPVDAPG